MNRSLGGYLRCFVFAIFVGFRATTLSRLKGIRQSWVATAVSARVGAPGFKRLKSAATGIDFQNLLGNERSIRNRNLLSGCGSSWGY